ncbi:MAG: hypothetical protein ACLP01_14040 [Solirubrobacteraceae bacterium]
MRSDGRWWLLSYMRCALEHLRPTSALEVAGELDQRETREQCFVEDLGCQGFAALTQPQMTIDARALHRRDAVLGIGNQRRQASTP